MAKTDWRKGAPLPADLQERLRALIRENGSERAAEMLGINSTTMLKAAAGSGVRDVTAIAITAKLEGLKQTA
jgi:hypothetical protein